MDRPCSPEASRPSIRVLIIGGSVGGLAAAIAFRRAGHEAFVFEARDTVTPKVAGGVRLPPNVTKILYHWGYEQRLRKLAVTSTAVDIRLLGTGEKLGRHVWEEELIRDAGGDFIFTHEGDFVHFLHEIAQEHGAVLHYDSRVLDVHLDKNTIVLENGQAFTGDIIVGADGENGISRSMFHSEEEQEVLFNVYSTTIPVELIRSDPLTAGLYDPCEILNAVWFGDGCTVLGWPLKRPEYALFVYGPPGGETTGWDRQGGKDRMLELLKDAEPRLRKLAEWAREPHIVTVNKATPLTDWYHDNGPLALVGNAAQPQTAGGVQEVAIGFEDGIVLGRIFSYLRRREQIPSFLEAYEDVCRERDIKTYYKELANIEFLTLPREHAEPRNALMREKGKNGQNLFGINMPADNAASDGWEEWQGIMDLFAYNAEEAADDWWQSHGRMIEASGGGVFDGPKLQILVALNIKEGKED